MSLQPFNVLRLLLIIVLGTVGTNVLADEHHEADEHHQHQQSNEHVHAVAHAPGPHVSMQIDAHYGHNRYYPPVGVSYHSLPSGYYTTHYHGQPYYFHEGIWYRHGGYGYVVARPPFGAYVTVLPPFYTTVWFGGMPYYYADNVYYRWDAGQQGYLVSQPPVSDTQPAASAAPTDDAFVYPKNNQSAEQQATDRYECYRWAADQTGFDPTKISGGVDAASNDNKRDDYRRAQAACLDARGYSVK